MAQLLHFRRYFACAWMLAFTPVGWCAGPPAAFVHPGMLQSRDDLDFMKKKVAASEQPWKQAWENLLHQPYSSPDFTAKPVAHIVRGAYGRGSVGDRDLQQSADAAYSQALQWYITGDRAHAQKAIDILKAWSGTLWDFEGNDAKLLAAWTGGPFCNAAEILRSTDSRWAAGEVEQFRRMLLTVYVPLLRNYFPEANGNWDAAIIDTLLSIAIFCDDHALFDGAANHFLRGEGNGGIAKYVYPSGQCEENTRDQGHTQLGLGYFALAARTAWTQGADLYGAMDNRLALGFEFSAKYMLGEDVSIYGIISQQGRGRFSDIYEGIYQHYHYLSGLPMTYTARALDKTRAVGWTALTMYQGPERAATHPLSGPPVAGQRIGLVGAMDTATVAAPTGAVTVAPGQSIQTSLDERAGAGGGWVILAKGLHTIAEPLRMPSGVTLAGEGKDSILLLDPKQTGPAIVSGSADMHDVTFRDFVVEGAIATRPSSDPNQDRRVRSYQNAPSRAGIILSGQRDGQMRNIRLEHLTVRHCTHQGVAIRGAAQVVIVASDFSDNGGSVVPGPGLEHNLALTHVIGAEVTGNRLDDSPWGDGLDVTESSDVTITGNEAARNHGNGLHLSDSRNVHLRGNVAEANDYDGVRLDALFEGDRNLEVVENLANNNGAHGIDIVRAVDGTVHANAVAGNGPGDQLAIVSSDRIR